MVPLVDNVNLVNLTNYQIPCSNSIGVFRLLAKDGREMFDMHTLYDYGIEMSDTITLQVWDGWAELLTAAIQGNTAKVFTSFSKSEVLCR